MTATIRSLARQVRNDARFYAELRSGKKGAGALPASLCSRGFWLLMFHRFTMYSLATRDRRSPAWQLARAVSRLTGLLSVLCFKSEIAGPCDFRGCAYLANEGHLICGARSIGNGVLIHGYTTIGFSVGSDDTRPAIGDNVWIGPHCIVAGDISIGDGATLLPGTFVTFSVRPGAVVEGNPAHVVREGFDNSALRRSLDIRPVLPPES